jgi:hypothetical protein
MSDIVPSSQGDNFPDQIGARIDQTSAELNKLMAEAAELSTTVSSDPSTALVEVTSRTPVEMKHQMAVVRSEVMKKQQEIVAKQEELRSLLEKKMSEVRAVITPLNAMVRKLEEGIWTANLYLGRDEEITQIRDGEPAPAPTPITVRQMVLAMDEECAIAEEEGGIDATSLDQFDEWLLESDDHLNQVFPEPRGVIALVPRWTDVDYGNPWETTSRNKENHQTYFLIRNGQRLYRYVTNFTAGERLVPAATEFTDFFYSKSYSWTERKPLEPGTDSWKKAESEADARKRHYMRVGLILQGIIDRTAVFHPLPGPVRFLEADDYDEGRIVIIADGDQALSDGRESFRDWQSRLMREIRPGMRIIGAFNTYDSRDDWEVYPKTASYPESLVPHVITERAGEHKLKFTFTRTDEIWGYHPDPDHPGWKTWGGRTPAKAASCKFSISSPLVLPFDLITVEDIDRFLNSRSERHQYVNMFPLLKASRRALVAEAAQEAPFRTMLAGVLSRDNGVTISEATDAISDLVDWWKLANKNHRPLVGNEQDNAKAVRMIIDEHKRRLADAKRPLNQTLITSLRATHHTALVIGRRRDGTYVVLEPQDAGDTFVVAVTYSARGVEKERLEWQLVGTGPSRWVIAYTSPAYATWNTMATKRDVFTGPEITEALQALVAERTKAGQSIAAVMLIDGTRGARNRSTALAALELETPKDQTLAEYWAEVKLHPLTTRYGEPGLKAYVVKLRRYPDGHIGWTRSTWSISYPTGITWPCWEPTSYAKDWRRIWEDQAVMDEATAAHDIYNEVRAIRSSLSSTVYSLEEQVAQQYQVQAERAAYEAFLEEYHDPDLWEGHSKTIKIDHISPGRRDFESVEPAVELLVEAGHVLDGLSVREAVERARVLYGFKGQVPERLADFTFDDVE